MHRHGMFSRARGTSKQQQGLHNGAEEDYLGLYKGTVVVYNGVMRVFVWIQDIVLCYCP